MKKSEMNSIVKLTNSKIAYDSFIKDEIKRKKNSRVICLIVCIILLGTSISIVYAEEIKEIVNTVIYKYISKEEQSDLSEYGVNKDATGIHLIKPSDVVYIKKFNVENEINNMKDAEDALDMKFLKLKDFNYKYFNLLYQSDNVLNTPGHPNKSDVNPEIISINGSNYKNFNCMITFIYNDDNSIDKDATKKEREECIKEQNANQPDKKLSISMYFATQYATKENVDRLVERQADFPNGQTEIYDSKRINGKVYKSRGDEYVFIYENVIYKIKNIHNSYSTDEILDMIENMYI